MKSSDSVESEKLVEKNVISDLIDNKDLICSWCFDVLQCKLKNEEFSDSPVLIEKLHKNGFKIPFFVKWMKLNDIKDLGSYDYGSYELKGCIGCLSQVDILQIHSYCLQSALNDARFCPITLKDIPYLIVTITYLFNFEECEHVYDWIIGKHGVTIHFTMHKRNYSSTFLPDVALEHNFNHQTTIRRLIRKANYQGEINNELINKIKVERYEGINCSLTYVDYEKLKS